MLKIIDITVVPGESLVSYWNKPMTVITIGDNEHQRMYIAPEEAKERMATIKGKRIKSLQISHCKANPNYTWIHSVKLPE